MHPAGLYQSTRGHKSAMSQSYFVIQGWGLQSHFRPFRYFPNFSSLSKHTLTVKYRVYIWRVLPQLSCGDTCQIWMWCEHDNMCFCKIKNFAYGKINERSFSNPHPRNKKTSDTKYGNAIFVSDVNRTISRYAICIYQPHDSFLYFKPQYSRIWSTAPHHSL